MLITPRPLVFFMIDDNDLLLPENCQITIWQPEDHPGTGNRASVNGWLQHVQQTYHDKEITFDALSIDVNFSRDRSDPMWFLNRTPPNDICAGLYHGLAALARRRGNDEHGNSLPCAWEVRTVAPGMQLTVEQEVEVTRIYGLLLALATPFEPDGGFIGLGHEVEVQPAEQVLEAFRMQPARSGAALDSIINLCPKWRDNFVDAVRARRVRVDHEGLKTLKADLLKALSKSGPLTLGILDHDLAVITLLDRDKVACEAILLRSIFADRNVVTADDFDEEVQPWVDQLLATAPADLSGYVSSSARWVMAAAEYVRTKEMPADAPQAAQEFLDLDDEQRMLVLVAYQVASVLDGKQFPPAEQPELAAAFGSDYNANLFRRALVDTIDLCSVKNLTQLQKDVLRKLNHPRLELRFAPTLCHALAGVLFECDLEDRVPEGFPALQRYIDLAS